MKSLALIAVLIAVTTARSLSGFKYQAEFNDWKRTHGKSYESDEIEMSRQLIWESNKNYVDNHNNVAAERLGFTLAMNSFADMETAEFKAMFNGLIPRDYTNYVSPDVHVFNGSAPSTMDWRDKGVVTPVKNQGQCGSCWSFSTTGSLEGQHALKTGTLVSLSEQQLMDCSTAEGNHGCKGGLMDNAFRYLETHKDETEAEYPYRAEDGFCHYKASEGVTGCTGYKDIMRGSESDLMDAVGTVGPISVAMDAGHKSFQLYHSGVYNEPECSSTRLDHGVLAVGYGTYEGTPYWLIKNSWGTVWGMEGYFMITRDSTNMCGIATQASYPKGVM